MQFSAEIKNVLAKMFRYFVVAALIVLLELVFFALLNSYFKIHYIASVIISFCLATVLNWYFSRKFVFASKNRKRKREIVLVFIVSLVGMGIQILVSVISVGYLGFVPLIGKIASMAITFFWNFWARFKFIFKETPAYEQENASGDSLL